LALRRLITRLPARHAREKVGVLSHPETPEDTPHWAIPSCSRSALGKCAWLAARSWKRSGPETRWSSS